MVWQKKIQAPNESFIFVNHFKKLVWVVSTECSKNVECKTCKPDIKMKIILPCIDFNFLEIFISVKGTIIFNGSSYMSPLPAFPGP